jgi:hypothetical protein
MSQAVRYVVLSHEGIDPPHFDLMFEVEPGSELLATWRSDHWPIESGDYLDRLPDHRRHYLDYEGPISDNRGYVRRIASGLLFLGSRGELGLVDGWFADTGVEISLMDEGDAWRCDLHPGA